MEEPPGSAPASQEGIKHLYDSPKYSDVTIIFKGSGYTHWQGERITPVKIHAHKAILAAGSSAFDEYFQANQEIMNGTVCEVQIKDIFDTDDDQTSESILDYIYGMPPDFQDCNRILSPQPGHWRGLFEAAEGFGIPSLRKLIFDKLVPHLRQLLVNVGDGDMTSLDQFVDEVQYIHDMATDEANGYGMPGENLGAVRDVAVQLCCEHYEKLYSYGPFIQVGIESPDIYRRMVAYFARDATYASG